MAKYHAVAFTFFVLLPYVFAACGDGKLDMMAPGIETCDDGNVAPGDGCSGACQIEVGCTCNAPMMGASRCDCGGGSNWLWLLLLLLPLCLCLLCLLFMFGSGGYDDGFGFRGMKKRFMSKFGVIDTEEGETQSQPGDTIPADEDYYGSPHPLSPHPMNNEYGRVRSPISSPVPIAQSPHFYPQSPGHAPLNTSNYYRNY